MLEISLVVVLAFGMLPRCGGSGENGEAPENVPANPEEAGEVVVRVSGTEGTAYAGTYGNLEQEGAPPTIEYTLEEEPTDYEVEIEGGVSDGVSAFFEKTEPGSGELEAEYYLRGVRVGDSGLVPTSRDVRGGPDRRRPTRREPLDEVRLNHGQSSNVPAAHVSSVRDPCLGSGFSRKLSDLSQPMGAGIARAGRWRVLFVDAGDLAAR
jgi:hypothetical protein